MVDGAAAHRGDAKSSTVFLGRPVWCVGVHKTFTSHETNRVNLGPLTRRALLSLPICSPCPPHPCKPPEGRVITLNTISPAPDGRWVFADRLLNESQNESPVATARFRF